MRYHEKVPKSKHEIYIFIQFLHKTKDHFNLFQIILYISIMILNFPFVAQIGAEKVLGCGVPYSLDVWGLDILNLF